MLIIDKDNRTEEISIGWVTEHSVILLDAERDGEMEEKISRSDSLIVIEDSEGSEVYIDSNDIPKLLEALNVAKSLGWW